MLDFNSEPYFNDFDEDNKFYSILFRPSVAVQARELNQLQTILQKQIKAQGDHVFKNGAVVIPGEFSINNSINYIKLTDTGTAPNISNLIGLKIQNTTGLEALVVHAVAAAGSDPITLYLSYTKSATDTTTKVFANSETLSSLTGGYTGITVAPSAASGFGSIATIQKGVYYINGYFVLCETQTITLDKYGITPSYRIGFNVIESAITSDDAGYESLLDNAQGSYNYAAPGAHRHFIDLVLDKITIDATSTTFSELGRIVNGVIISAISTTGYSQLEKTFARRTYDESGDYTVKPFQIDVREHRDNNRGAWNSGKAYKAGDVVTNSGRFYQAIADMLAGVAAPVHTSGIVLSWEQKLLPSYNRGIYSADALSGIVGNIDKLAIGFEPGKAYVQGYEIEKLATTYVEVPKPRDPTVDTAFENSASVATSVGSFVIVTNLNKLPPMATGAIVSIYDYIVTTGGTPAGAIIGTCRVSAITTESGSGATTYCKMFIYDVKLNSGKDFSRDVKSFYFAGNTFTANVVPDTYSLPVGSVTWLANPIILTGVGTQWATGTVSQRLKVGDWLYFGTNKAVVTGGITDTNVSITAITLAASTTPVAALRIQTKLSEPNSTSLVFPLPHYANKTVADHIYYMVQSTTNTSAVGSVLNITASGTLLPDASNYYVQDASGATVSVTSVSATGGTAALTLASTPSMSFTVLATVYKTGITARKNKTLTSASQTFTAAQANATVLTLTNADCYKLVNVMMGSVDISSWYLFNDGQKDSYYDVGSLVLQPSYPTPSASVTVNYQYFVHSAGEFCDLHSYVNLDYTLIPYYGGINLRDTIDFRPVISSGVFSGFSVPKRGYNMSVDLTYYLARQDKLSIDTAGSFFLTKGSSSLNPGLPTDSSTGMTLCALLQAPYVFNTADILVTKIENKRYTMRDIGKLETRINNIEYYTSLSLLEQETSSLNITDANGLDRFKNGFIVDNFSGHNIGDVSSIDYMCSVDMENNELRPFASIDNINLLVDTTTSTSYKLYGDVITLPLNATTPHVELAKNDYASRTEFVNPFAVFTFLGNVKINPSSDDWFEVKRLPDIITNKEGNFNILTQMAARVGVLGTVWNSWQTQWTGAPVVTSAYSGTGAAMAQAVGATGQAISLSVGLNRAVWGWDIYAGNYSLTTTSAQQVGQSRTGINTTAVAKIDTQVVDDRVLSIAVIPYMRSRNMLVQVKGLKPFTRFYPFFDNIDISAYCTPSTIFNYTPVSGTFDDSTNSGITATTDSVRKLDGDTQVCLNVGDVVSGTTAKAVVVGKERTITNAGVVSYKLFVQNVIGTFGSGETITGSISGAVGTFLSSSVPTTFATTSSGDLNLRFKIPNSDSVRFRTGTREFKLQDASVVTGQYTSQGVSNYTASGTIQTKQANVVATRNVEFVQNQVSDNRTIVESSTRVVSGTAWYDPLAQTFLVDSKGGAFISKVDLFFASKDGNIPVTIEIREVVNGYPGKVVLPFSRVTVESENVNLSSTSVITFDGVSYPKYDTPTTVSFSSPVYVKDKTEYALVILSDSNQYKVWISQMGDAVPDSSDTISKQPYLGVLFKSQNASTWTASQDQDLKFTIWRANFDTTATSNVILTNDYVSKLNLMTDPFQTLAGSTTARVWHENHGFKTGDSVTISGAVSSDATATTAMLNTTFSISNPQIDSYTVVLGAAATSTNFTGGIVTMATRSVRYETLQPSISALGFSDTTLNYTMVTTEASTGLANVEDSCIVNDNNYFYTPQIISSSATGKLKLKAIMTSSNPALSPLIDSHGSSAIVVSNKIDSPVESTFNIAAIDDVTIISVSCTLSGTTLATADAPSRIILSRVKTGSYIMFTGSATNTSFNSVKFLVTAVATDGTGTLTLSRSGFTTFVTETIALAVHYYNSFFDEITPIGSSTHSKYVSKVITLANQSSLLRIKYAVCAPTESDVLVYYKIGNSGINLANTNWILATPDKTMPKTAIGSNVFYDIDYTIANLPAFTLLTVKLVMKSTNTAAVPRVKDLRIIAVA